MSCFDGISCGHVALDRAGISYLKYLSSEIDKHAIKIAHTNYNDIFNIGDIVELTSKYIKNLCDLKIDLLMGGSPCQGFSKSGKKLNFSDSRSKLFFEFVKIKDAIKPKYFLLENVRMKQEWQDVISEYLGVEPVEINSSLFSAQSRGRLYWTNINYDKNIQDRGINFKSILQPKSDVDKKYFLSNKTLSRLNLGTLVNCGYGNFKKGCKESNKAVALLARDYKGVPGLNDFNLVIQDGEVRKLTPVEYERLQTLPDNYTSCVSDTQRYKVLGNCWTVDVVSHILKGINNG